ncbi:hypothetical protein YC2023_040778 [Brassica napus]
MTHAHKCGASETPATALKEFGWQHLHFPVEAFSIQLLFKASALPNIKDLRQQPTSSTSKLCWKRNFKQLVNMFTSYCSKVFQPFILSMCREVPITLAMICQELEQLKLSPPVMLLTLSL